MNRNKIRERCLSADPLKQDLRGSHAHLVKRLTDGCEARVMKGGTLDVVESDDRNIVRDLQPMIHQCLYGADRSNIVVADERGEIAAALDQFICRLVSKFWGGDPELKLNSKF